MRRIATWVRPRGALWKNADFLRLWSGQTISAFGSEISELAIPLVAILVLDASAFQVATLGIAVTVPWLLLSLPAGAWVDRLRRRPILIVADWGRALALLSIPVAYVLDVLTLPQLYVAGFVAGALTVFFDVSYQSYLPSLVEREQLTDANGKLQVSATSAQTAGPAIAGGLIGLVTAPYAILVDSLSFVASALFLRRIKRSESHPIGDSSGRQRLRSEIADGLRFTFRHPILRSSIVFVASSNLCTSIIFAIYLLYAVRTLDLSPATIGLIGSLGNVGLLVGALSAPRLSARFGVGPVLVAAGAGSGWSLLLIPLASGGLVFPMLVGAWFGFGVCAVVYNVAGISLMQAITPDRMLGRMTATRRFIVFGVGPLGMLLGGALGTSLGLQETMWIGAIGASVAFVSLLVSPIPGVRTVADAEQIVAADIV